MIVASTMAWSPRKGRGFFTGLPVGDLFRASTAALLPPGFDQVVEVQKEVPGGFLGAQDFDQNREGFEWVRVWAAPTHVPASALTESGLKRNGRAPSRSSASNIDPFRRYRQKLSILRQDRLRRAPNLPLQNPAVEARKRSPTGNPVKKPTAPLRLPIKPAGMCELGECPTRILDVSAESKTEQTQNETQHPDKSVQPRPSPVEQPPTVVHSLREPR